MTIEELQNMIKADLYIDKDNISESLVKIPGTYSKYLTMLQNKQLTCLRLKAKLDTLYRERYLYYRNDYSVLLKNKSEIDILIDGEEEFQIARDKLDLQKNMCVTIEGAMKQISGLSFLIKDYIAWEQFRAGA